MATLTGLKICDQTYLGVAPAHDLAYTLTVGADLIANGDPHGAYPGGILLYGAVPSNVKFHPGTSMSYAGLIYTNRLVLCRFDTDDLILSRPVPSAIGSDGAVVAACHVDSELSSEFHF